MPGVIEGNMWSSNKSIKINHPELLLDKSFASSSWWSRNIFNINQLPVEPGPSTSIYKGSHKQHGVIAVKVWRMYHCSNGDRDKFYHRLEKGLLRWKSLSHPNIAQVFGTIEGYSKIPALVMEYYEPGNVNRYIKANPDVDVLGLLRGIAAALSYLHSFNPPIVHGNIRGSNIFVTPSGNAVLSDLTISHMRVPNPPEWTVECGDAVRWMAPEAMTTPAIQAGYTDGEAEDECEAVDVYDDDEFEWCFVTTKTDVYSFGMTMLELYTGKAPFQHRKSYGPIVFEVTRGIRPFRPRPHECVKHKHSQDTIDVGIRDDVWELVEACWKHNPLERPNMKMVKSWIEVISQQISVSTSSSTMTRGTHRKLPSFSLKWRSSQFENTPRH